MFVVLLVSDPTTSRKPVKLFELIIVALVSFILSFGGDLSRQHDHILSRHQVFVVFICFIILIVKLDPNWKLVMAGFIPSHILVQNNSMYISQVIPIP